MAQAGHGGSGTRLARVQRGRAKLRDLFEDCCRLEFDVRRRLVDYECGPGQRCDCAAD